MKRLLLALLLVAAPALAAPHWQHDITAPDRKRLAKLWEAWTRGLGEAQTAGQGPAVAAFGPAVVADAATINAGGALKSGQAFPQAGDYRCRVIRLGQRAGEARAPLAAAAVTEAAAPCRITMRRGSLWFEQGAGTQRLGGRLYADGARMVFLGSTALAGEMAILPYGADPQRDVVGALRPLATGWRLELPWPNWQSNLVVVEIVPA